MGKCGDIHSFHWSVNELNNEGESEKALIYSTRKRMRQETRFKNVNKNLLSEW